MLSLLCCLKYVCTGCGDPIDTTLQCEGPGVKDNDGAIFKMHCPDCGAGNEIAFTPDGTVHGVWRTRRYERIPEPSIN
jgi:hypothetical protein